MRKEKEFTNWTDLFAYGLCYALLWVLSLLPFRILYWLSDSVYGLLYCGLQYRVRIVRKNLGLAFPEKSEEERHAIERKFYRHLCDVIVETIKVMHFSDRQVAQRIRFRHVEIMNEWLRQGHPVMVFLGHYGNWEWVQQIGNLLDDDFTAGVLFRPQKSAVFNRLMMDIRNRWRLLKIAQKDAVRKIFQFKQEGKPFTIGFISDQRPNSPVLDNWTTFLGQETAYVAGAETMGAKVNAKYVFFDISKPRRGHYEVDIIPVTPSPIPGEHNPHTIHFLQLLEASIRKQPELWLWSHNRWGIPGYSKIKKRS